MLLRSERIIYKIAHMQTQSSQMNVELKRWELGETSVMNETESLQDSDFLSTNVGQKRRLQKFSLPKQNKDGANAARTARITLISMVLSQSKREVVQALRSIKETINVKKLMLNIGEKQFKERFLYKKELKRFFYNVFDSISPEDVAQFLRKNKRSQLEYKERIDLCFDYIKKYKSAFEEKFTQTRILIPVPLSPQEYSRYMMSRGFNFPSQ